MTYKKKLYKRSLNNIFNNLFFKSMDFNWGDWIVGQSEFLMGVTLS